MCWLPAPQKARGKAPKSNSLRFNMRSLVCFDLKVKLIKNRGSPDYIFSICDTRLFGTWRAQMFSEDRGSWAERKAQAIRRSAPSLARPRTPLKSAPSPASCWYAAPGLQSCSSTVSKPLLLSGWIKSITAFSTLSCDPNLRKRSVLSHCEEGTTKPHELLLPEEEAPGVKGHNPLPSLEHHWLRPDSPL